MVHEAIVFAGLMPHAPILVPGVGGERLAEAESTAGAMTALASRAVASHPDTVVLISPHSPRRPKAFGIWETPRVRGSLASFGSPEDKVDLPTDRDFAARLEKEADHRGIRTWRISGEPLDHGATVPLCYLIAAGWKGPTVILSLNYPGEGGIKELGEAVAATAQGLHRRTVFIASGDMSHRLKPSAPAGHHPDAHRFDETFIELLRKGAYADIQRIDPELQEIAGEDVADSTLVALAATGYHTDGHKVLSYEGPWGVGYGVAVLYEPPNDPPAAPPAPPPSANILSRFTDLPMVARRAVEAEFRGEPRTPPFRAAGELLERHGVFVTLRTADGELRGCRGTIHPMEDDLVLETWRNAVATAFHDYRFSAVQKDEFPRLHFSVTVLEEPEPALSPADLDPAVFGVVVESADGRKALLLPRIEGIETVERQLEIVRRKAGIGPDEPVELQRFKADCYEESPPAREEGGDAR